MPKPARRIKRAPDGPRPPKETDAQARDAVVHGVSATVVPASIRSSGKKKADLSQGRAEISPTGCGKTHTSHARVRAVTDTRPPEMLYVPAGASL